MHGNQSSPLSQLGAQAVNPLPLKTNETIFADLRQARNGLHELLRRMEALVDRAGLSVNVANPQGTNANVPVPENLCMVKNEIADIVNRAHQAMDRLENIA